MTGMAKAGLRVYLSEVVNEELVKFLKIVWEKTVTQKDLEAPINDRLQKEIAIEAQQVFEDQWKKLESLVEAEIKKEIKKNETNRNKKITG